MRIKPIITTIFGIAIAAGSVFFAKEPPFRHQRCRYRAADAGDGRSHRGAGGHKFWPGDRAASCFFAIMADRSVARRGIHQLRTSHS